MPSLKWLALKYAWKQRHHVLAAAASATTMVTTTMYSIAGIQRPLPIKVSDVRLVLNADVPERLCRIKPYIELKVRSGVDRTLSKGVRTTHAQEDNHCDGRMIQFRDTLQLLAVPARDTVLVELWTRRRFLTPTRIGFCEIPLAALVADENSERQLGLWLDLTLDSALAGDRELSHMDGGRIASLHLQLKALAPGSQAVSTAEAPVIVRGTQGSGGMPSAAGVVMAAGAGGASVPASGGSIGQPGPPVPPRAGAGGPTAGYYDIPMATTVEVVQPGADPAAIPQAKLVSASQIATPRATSGGPRFGGSAPVFTTGASGSAASARSDHNPNYYYSEMGGAPAPRGTAVARGGDVF